MKVSTFFRGVRSELTDDVSLSVCADQPHLELPARKPKPLWDLQRHVFMGVGYRRYHSWVHDRHLDVLHSRGADPTRRVLVYVFSRIDLVLF